jgi:F-type H+-transporting ATPase subunit epsilon
MAETIQVEVVTPEKILFSDPATMVEAPGAEGDFGVLVDHAPFVSLLRPGLVSIHKEGGAVERLFVTGGLAQVDGQQIVILAEDVRDLATLTASDAESLLVEARNAVGGAENDAELKAAEHQLAIAQALADALKTVH